MHISTRWRVTTVAAAASSLLLSIAALTSTALASGPYAGELGFDISYPQCGQPTPSDKFAIVGVNGGKPFTANTCFGAEFSNAVHSVGGANNASIYMNLSAPVGTTATQYTSGPQTCKPGDKVCQAQNYGWNAAAYAYKAATAGGYTSSAGGVAPDWWLDIETANSWSGQTSVNRASIHSATNYLMANGLTAGIYSDASMWNRITGNWSSNVQSVWYAGTSGTSCIVGSFTSGPVWLVQNSSGTKDGDQGC